MVHSNYVYSREHSFIIIEYQDGDTYVIGYHRFLSIIILLSSRRF